MHLFIEVYKDNIYDDEYHDFVKKMIHFGTHLPNQFGLILF